MNSSVSSSLDCISVISYIFYTASCLLRNVQDLILACPVLVGGVHCRSCRRMVRLSYCFRIYKTNSRSTSSAKGTASFLVPHAPQSVKCRSNILKQYFSY